MRSKIQNDFKARGTALKELIANFKNHGKVLGDGERNTIKLFELDEITINVKSFKRPNLLNRIVYRYFRKSKAERSYTYANMLLEKGIGTPQPIAYFENSDLLGLKDSYYLSRHLDYDLTYRELVHEPMYPDHENILRQFTAFTWKLHQNRVLFKDHSPGNTLIVKEREGYAFYLVDLNRMEFKPLTFEERIRNFARLTPKKEMVAVMSDEYAKLTGEDYEKIYDLMWELTSKFQEKYHRKVRLKQKYLFWRRRP
ncbi:MULTISPECIES: lipopolysaccharide kinase InaA family protein [Altibacter]|uniref:lipopolysaccharide kinase InaA family protein n=1 Tax=Altibacter TaxID=1535231 RepID=UPI00054CFFB4|nr:MULTISPECIES: lipopolysaccharide kinase InaA family protein [Altibacter]MCW9037459.1 Kdo domain containing protein [Altibacter sp.]